MEKLEDFKKELLRAGFIVPDSSDFYYNRELNKFGLKVGEYFHSCHVDSTHIVVLLTNIHEKWDTVSSWGYLDGWREYKSPNL